MYAIIETGGKQYKVAVGDKVTVEKITLKHDALHQINDDLSSENEQDHQEIITIDKVLMIVDHEKEIYKIGKPLLNSTVSAKIIGQIKDDKVKIVKFNRRKHSKKSQGHRQRLTNLEIIAINYN